MIENAVPSGSSVSEVLAFLEQHSIEHSEYLGESKTIRAIVRNTVKTATVSGAIQMIFTFDENRQLIHSEIEEVYTGP